MMYVSPALQKLNPGILGWRSHKDMWDFQSDRSATVAVRFPGRNSREFAQTLKQANVIASLRRDFIRFSPHYYNNIDDIDQGLAAIEAAL